MTRCQAQIVRAISSFKETNGYTPSVRELAAETGKATSTIMYHLNNMERAGLIRRSGRAYGIELMAA